MDHVKVLKRAWDNVIRYRALWVFGIIVALSSVSAGATTLYNAGNVDQDEREWQGFQLDLKPGVGFREAFGEAMEQLADEFEESLADANAEIEDLFSKELGVEVEADLLRTLMVFVLVVLALAIVVKIAGYISEAALIKMVNHREETGEKLSFREGLRLGWSVTAWRIFLIDLVIAIPVFLLVILMIFLIVAPIFLWMTGSVVTGILGTIATVGFFFLAVFLAIVGAVVIHLLKRFFRRASALNDVDVFEAIREGYGLVRRNLKDAGIMWLIMLGVDLAWPIVIAPAALAIAPVGIFLGVSAGALAGSLAGLGLGGAAQVALGMLVGFTIFVLVVGVPLAFLGGLRQVFQSSSWTLTYRELTVMESLTPDELPSGDEAEETE